MRPRLPILCGLLLSLALLAAACSSELQLPIKVVTLTPENPTASATAIYATDTPTGVAVTPVPTLASTALPSATATLTSTAAPPSGSLTPSQLKYKLLAQFPDFFFCDPDQYPVAREVSAADIDQRVAALAKNTEEYQAILNHLGISPQATLTDQQMALVYLEAKKLDAIPLTPAGGVYQFSLRTAKGRAGTAISGTIDAQGAIVVAERTATIATCPICLARGTLIDTPNGAIPVQDLRRGMAVWTMGVNGTRQSAVVTQTISRAVPADFGIIHLVLDDSREVMVSPNHPTAEGRTAGGLQPGDELDGARVVTAERIPYPEGETFDILPSGATGEYWANGILLKSTLAP